LLTDDILSYTEIQPAETSITTVDLNDVLKTTLQKLNRRIEETDASIQFDKLPHIKGYFNLLLLLFHHLLDNAIKFRKEKEKPVIQIKYSQVKGMNINHAHADPAAAYHVISVEDKGIGIDKIHLERVFQMFYVAQERGKYKGSGIGLAICKKVMDIHDGFIIAQSAPEYSGTTFNCFFPLQKAPPRGSKFTEKTLPIF
jgi:light-regulated signal transduction histidine kinase (bacteriophytochrome)